MKVMRNDIIRVRVDERGTRLLYLWAAERGNLGVRWAKGNVARWQFLNGPGQSDEYDED